MFRSDESRDRKHSIPTEQYEKYLLLSVQCIVFSIVFALGGERVNYRDRAKKELFTRTYYIF